MFTKLNHVKQAQRSRNVNLRFQYRWSIILNIYYTKYFLFNIRMGHAMTL